MCVSTVLVAKLDKKDDMVKKQEVDFGRLDPSLSAVREILWVCSDCKYLITWQQQSLSYNVFANKLSCSERKAHFTLDTSVASQMSARPPCCHIIRQAHSQGSRVAGFHLSTNTITMFLQT